MPPRLCFVAWPIEGAESAGLRPVVGGAYSFGEAAAHAAIDARRPIGKDVLVPER